MTNSLPEGTCGSSGRIAWKVVETDRTPGTFQPRSPTPGPGDWTHQLAVGAEDRIVARDRDVARIDARAKLLWPAPFTCSGRPYAAYLSETRLLILTHSLEYHRWGFLGPALLLDYGDGSLVKELRGNTAAVFGGGRFLLGLGGYDVFDTWLHNRDGEIVQQWRSFGHYVVDLESTIRVLERDGSIPTKSRIVRLRPDGEIERGPKLAEGQVSAPVTFEDGTVVFVDCGRLCTVDRELRMEILTELIPVTPDQAWCFTVDLSRQGSKLTIEIWERTEDPPIEYTRHRWLLNFTQG